MVAGFPGNKKSTKDKAYSILYNNLVTESDKGLPSARETTLSLGGEIPSKEKRNEEIS